MRLFKKKSASFTLRTVILKMEITLAGKKVTILHVLIRSALYQHMQRYIYIHMYIHTHSIYNMTWKEYVAMQNTVPAFDT